MAWRGEGWERQSPAKAFFRPVGRRMRVLAMRHHPTPNHSLAGLTGGFTAMFRAEGAHLCAAPRRDKQTAENQSRLMIAENLAGSLSDKTPGKQRERR